jgi:glycosyltransferase involved in cell wall biosynthesis
MVSRTRYQLPLQPGLERKLSALARRLDLRVLACARAAGPRDEDRFRLLPPFPLRPLDGLVFYLALPLRVARELRSFRPDVVLAQSPYEGLAVLIARRLARARPALVVELHGDWRSFARLYGSPLRRLLAPVSDRLALAALRRAEAVRTLSPYTSDLARRAGVEPAAEFPAFTDGEAFAARPPLPLPARPQAVFVGVLERYKDVDTVARVWRQVAACLPDACLHLVGDGHRRAVVEELVSALPSQTRWTPSVANAAVPGLLDQAWCLLLPSRAEGTPRIVVEAFARGRAVVATRVGGVPDLVEDGVSGFLLPSGDVEGIAAALLRLLSDRKLAERMGRAARERAAPWLVTPEEYAERTAALVERALAGR